MGNRVSAESLEPQRFRGFSKDVTIYRIDTEATMRGVE